MPLYARKTVFAVDRSVPVIFTEPVNSGDTLVFDPDMGVFTNEAFSSAITLTNTGTGTPLASFDINQLKIKSLAGGSNITLSDDGHTITINNSSTAIVADMDALNALTPSSDNGRTALVLDAGDSQPGFFVFNGTWLSAGGGSGGQINLAHVDFDYTSGSTINITTIPASGVIISTSVSINTTFNGSPPSLSIGTPDIENLLIDPTEVDLTQLRTFKDDTTFILPDSGNQVINAYFTSNGSTHGQATIFVFYSLT